MFMKGIGQNLTRKILSWITLIWIGPANLLNLNEKNVDLTTNSFFNAINSLLNKYAPF